jgi:long-subunit fatty acid transport protein
MKNIFYLTLSVITALLAGTGISLAEFSKSDAGTTASQFLKLGAGARAEGMGEAFAGMADDSTAIYWNPAGLNRIEDKSVSFMYAVWFEDISYDWVSYAQKIGNAGSIGIGAQYLSYGAIKQTDETGLEGGDFTPMDIAISLSYGISINKLLLGINMKYVSSKIMNTSGNAYAGDFGVMYPMMDDRFWLGAAVQNFGGQMSFTNEEDPLPLNIKLGGAYALLNNWKLALDANAPVDNDIYFGIGSEYTCALNKTMNVTVRLGYNSRTNDTEGLNGPSAGLGFRYRSYMIDYAFVPYGELGNTQQISLSEKF